MTIKKLESKKAALELSIGTIVILVLAMSMLILGLVLVRTIFKGATETVNILEEKVQAEITNLFVEEDANIVVKLGADKVARVRADGKRINIAFGAKTIDGSTIDINEFKYRISLDTGARENCITELGERKVEEFISQKINTRLKFDDFQGDAAFASIEVKIPEGTKICSQKVFIDVEDRGQELGRASLIIEIISKGFF